jgi:hypothetical protein
MSFITEYVKLNKYIFERAIWDLLAKPSNCHHPKSNKRESAYPPFSLSLADFTSPLPPLSLYTLEKWHTRCKYYQSKPF